jgi:parallel beta-helix repeat protein
MYKILNARIWIFVVILFLFIYLPVATAEMQPQDYTYLVSDTNDNLNGRTPLIVVHGIHGNITPYWDPFKTYFYHHSDLYEKYKLYFFTYLSDYITVDQIGEGLRWWVDFYTDNGTLEDVPFLILSHSMGGLVSRAFMLKQLQNGNWAGKFAGDRVVKLITLATPHHGSVGASRCCRDQLTASPTWLTAIEAFDFAYWTLGYLIISPKSPNRSDLRWDNYDGSMTPVGYDNACSPWDRNDWLLSLNNLVAFDEKIIAYAGYIDPDNPERVALVLSGPEIVASTLVAAKLAGDERLMAICAGISLKEGLRSIYGDNDGMVPFNSANFAGHSAVQRQNDFIGFDHGEMKGDNLVPGTDGRYEQLFNRIYSDLLVNCVSISVEPGELNAPVEVNLATSDRGYAYVWEINDPYNPQTIHGAQATHKFRHNGSYSVSLTVNDGSSSYTYNKTIAVRKPDIEVDSPDGFTSLKRAFSTPNSDLITEYTWNFGDGSPAETGRSREHTYQESGYYSVTLSLTLDDGSTLQNEEGIWVGPGTRYIPGHTIYGDETWSGGGTYVIQGDISIADSGILIVEPGAEVRVTDNGDISVSGTLNATGATFTWADGVNGWDGIRFKSGSSSSRLENCVIEHVSDSDYSDHAILVDSSSPTIAGCTIGNVNPESYSVGIYIDNNSSPLVTGNTISGWSTGIFVSGSSSPTVTGNTIRDNEKGIDVQYGTNNPVFTGNTYANNSYRDLTAHGTIAEGTSVTWPSSYDPVTISTTLSIAGNLTIEPGMIVKGLDNGDISVSGTLNATGATFTWADGVNGWDGIRFKSGSSSSRLENCVIEHVSDSDYSDHAILVDSSSPTIAGCTIGNVNPESYSVGIYIDNNSSPLVTGNTISGWSTGIFVSGSSSPTVTGNTIRDNLYGIRSSSTVGFIVSGCTIFNNSLYGIYNSSSVTIDAKNNRWGHPTGPHDPSDDSATGGLYNPNGKGDNVSDYVGYYPWSGRAMPWLLLLLDD